MCLRIDKEFETRRAAKDFTLTPLVAEKNIYVYKCLLTECKDEFWYSPYRGAPYSPGFSHHVNKFSFKFLKWTRWQVQVRHGIHAFLKKEDAKEFVSQNKLSVVYAIVKCSIPKGTQYFKNKNQIVSLQLHVPELNAKKIGNKFYQLPKTWELC
jgi:hypothetical protein